ncbi:MAG: SDR family NAD(P)-dependent oxidoreductase [Myxococcaceae bacterium]|nr:MAG: SDR family NAD(P)-dependent oxidoreductase [Myxococcaceae bacterium]
MLGARKELLSQRGVSAIDVLIANAGVMNTEHPHDDFFVCTPEEMEAVWKTNVSGTLLTLQHFGELVLSSRHKVAVVMSSYLGSIQSTAKTSGYTCYRTSKAGLNMLAMAYATDPKVKDAGGKIVCLHPGWVQTDMGGTSAPMTVSQSAANMLGVIDQACDVTTGAGGGHRSAFKDKLAVEIAHFRSASMAVLEGVFKLRALVQQELSFSEDVAVSVHWKGVNYILKMGQDYQVYI